MLYPVVDDGSDEDELFMCAMSTCIEDDELVTDFTNTSSPLLIKSNSIKILVKFLLNKKIT